MKHGKARKRNSSIEFLRILCLILIIVHHYTLHGGYQGFTTENFDFNVLLIQEGTMFGKAAVMVFMLISGYYMCNKTKDHDRMFCKNFSLFAEMLFYSVAIMLIVSFTHTAELTLTDKIKACFPLIWGNWFVVYYLLFCLLVPFINRILQKTSEKQLRTLLMVLYLIWTVIPTASYWLVKKTWSFSYVDVFLIMYLTGAYLRMFNGKQRWSRNKAAAFMCLSIFFLIGSVVILDYIGLHTGNDIWIQKAVYFRELFMLPSVILAISAFMFFQHLQFYSPFINGIAKSVIGIYLIHDNEILRPLLWEKISPNAVALAQGHIAGHMLVKCCAVFMICLLIDEIRMLITERFFQKGLDRIYYGISGRIGKLGNSSESNKT